MTASHLLSVVTFLPLAGGLAVLLLDEVLGLLSLSRLSEGVWRWMTLALTALTFALSLGLWTGFDATRIGFQFVERAPWLPDYGVSYFVGIDGVSLLLLVMTTFLMPLVILSSWKDIQRGVRTYLFFMLALETGMLGAFVSLNLFQFYVFWEVMLIPMYFIIGIWGGPRRIYAAVKFFLYTMSGSLLMLVALLVVYYLHFQQFGALNLDLVQGPGSAAPALFDTVIPVAGQAVWWKTQTWLFVAFALAFAVKVPLFPFHTWLPDAHVEAPTAGSVVLASVLLKMGTYGFIRLALPLFPFAAVEFAPVIFALSLMGILYAALVAMVQADMKKLVAYSSVAHLGFVMMGMFAFNIEGVEGSVLQMVNHGFSTGALFLLVGMIYERRHTRLIKDFGGIAKPMPVYAALFGVVAMSSIGLPMLNGFVGEFLILLGTYHVAPWVAVAGSFGVVLAAAYMLWMLRRVMFGPVDNPENRGLIDLGLREKFVMVAVLLPIFWVGIYPDFFLRRLDASVTEVLRRVETANARTTAPGGHEAADPNVTAAGHLALPVALELGPAR
ncbi:MAG TPA: NADH-quinone oxidoreductase subunit M [Myxococcota bacterium]|nr:NADH-quinone oxidoreductase subunit M [Myxococcota bacterium]